MGVECGGASVSRHRSVSQGGADHVSQVVALQQLKVSQVPLEMISDDCVSDDTLVRTEGVASSEGIASSKKPD